MSDAVRALGPLRHACHGCGACCTGHSVRLIGDEPERIAQYRYHLRQFDDALAHLHGRLDEAGFDQSNTVFVVIADHGEGMNYPGHHGFGHGQYHTSSTAHVPWLMAGPGVAAHHRFLHRYVSPDGVLVIVARVVQQRKVRVLDP